MIHVYRCLRCRALQTVTNPRSGPQGPSVVPCSCGAPMTDLFPVDCLHSFDEWTGSGRWEFGQSGGEVLVTLHLLDMGVQKRPLEGLSCSS